jgi:hypothetical protein
MQITSDPNITEFVVVSEILPDEVNTYCNGFLSQVVDRVNGVQVHSIKDVITELKKVPSGDCHQITFMGNDAPMILDAAQVAKKQQSILKKYEVPVESYIEE